MGDVVIRPLTDLDELRDVVDLQKTYWGSDVESVIPAHMLFSLANSGGHVLTALDEGKPVGMLVGFLGTANNDPRRPAMANLQIVSKRMVVLPEYRGGGIGYRLKLAQRDRAISQGVRLVTWTFDPLLALNAHLNIRKLGAICPRFMEDYYGTQSEGGLALLGSSDRLLVEWWVTNRRVEERLFGKRVDLALEQYLSAESPILNTTSVRPDGLVAPEPAIREPFTSLALIEIPVNYPEIILRDAELARAWRAHIRQIFRRVFPEGFVITDFLRETVEGRDRAFYVMSYDGPQFDSIRLN
jgi:predicted GNAT superfamily acetyltransferase